MTRETVLMLTPDNAATSRMVARRTGSPVVARWSLSLWFTDTCIYSPDTVAAPPGGWGRGGTFAVPPRGSSPSGYAGGRTHSAAPPGPGPSGRTVTSSSEPGPPSV
ncbi:hypothetical protein GCM10026982_30340 [Nocardiopsis aegyptia]